MKKRSGLSSQTDFSIRKLLFAKCTKSSYININIVKTGFQGLRSEYLTKDLVAISPDTVVVVDSVDSKVIRILDAGSGKELNKVTHTAEVVWYVRTLFCDFTGDISWNRNIRSSLCIRFLSFSLFFIILVLWLAFHG